MIIQNLDKPRDGRSSFRRAVEYAIFGPASDRVDPNERVLYSGSRNLESSQFDLDGKFDVSDIWDEMTSTARQNKSVAGKRSDPVVHVVMSWREGEVPTEKQCQEAVEIFAKEQRLEDCQIFWAVHRDTDNLHLDLVINRVKTTDHTLAPMHFKFKANERAARRIEITQGWTIEKSGHLALVEEIKNKQGKVIGHKLRCKGQKKKDDEKVEEIKNGRGEVVGFKVIDDFVKMTSAEKEIARSAISQTARAFEVRTGLISDETRAKRIAAPIILAAKSWRELHETLAEKGITYEKSGSGAKLIFKITGRKKDGHATASGAGRQCSLKNIERRLGKFEPRAQTLEIKPDVEYAVSRSQNELKMISERYEAQKNDQKEITAAQERFFQFFNSWKDQARADLKTRQEKELAELHERGAVAEKILELEKQHERQYSDLEREIRQRLDNKPKQWELSLKDWLQEQGREEDAEAWRYRRSNTNMLIGFEVEFKHAAIQNYVPSFQYIGDRERKITDYKATDGHTAFRDVGRHVDVFDWRDSDAVLAALQLGQDKWGGVTVHGCTEFLALTVDLAAEVGFTIKNPELQDQIVARRKDIDNDRQRISGEKDPGLDCRVRELAEQMGRDIDREREAERRKHEHTRARSSSRGGRGW